jgi:Fic family protein
MRAHSGRIRQPGRGFEFLTFGPNRSVSNRECPAQLDRAFENARRALARADRDSPAGDYEEVVLSAAVQLHAELVRIHPFEDGNGRSSRLLLNVVLVSYGLPPIEVERIKAEYNECLNHYFSTSDLEPLLALLLKTYDDPGKLLA